MEDVRFDGKLDYKIDNIGYVRVLRNENYIFEYKTGKERYSFVYVESGELEYSFPKSQNIIKIDKGSLLFIPKRFPYKTKYLKQNTMIKIIIFDIIGEHLPLYLTTPFPKKSSDISSVFASISNQNMQNTLFLSSKIYELIYHLQNNNLSVPKKYLPIIPAVNAIKQAYHENQKISYYAEMCHMSESNFRLLFKQYTGKSPIEYRNLIRISEAKKMIDSGEFTVSEAAYLTGFNNMAFFYEVYNKS